jgi:cystathionine beta-lyase/cystathionine gamma-synthase
MNWSTRSLATRVIHAGDPRPRIAGALTIPIFQSSVFEHRGEEGVYEDVRYPRLNNLPNHEALGRKVAALEEAEAGLVAASGMAAITTALLAALGQGGHLLVQGQLYGGTHMFVTHTLASLGLSYDVIDVQDPSSWAGLIRPTTRAIYVESLTNPLLEVADHGAIVRFATERSLVTIIDNTFASPINFRPVAFGYDLVVHSATKYLNGHNDLVAGAVAGSAEWLRKILLLQNELGGSLDPHACYLLNRGLKTLALRVQQQNINALELARSLARREGVRVVHYPGLEAHPQHARARELFDGFGGMLSFELEGGLDAARRVLSRLEIPVQGPSLGGVETLITRPAVTSHAGLSENERRRLGVTDGLLRVSVGVESAADIVGDFEQALSG